MKRYDEFLEQYKQEAKAGELEIDWFMFAKLKKDLYIKWLERDNDDTQKLLKEAYEVIQPLENTIESMTKSINQIDAKCNMYYRSKAKPNQCVDFIWNIVLTSKENK